MSDTDQLDASSSARGRWIRWVGLLLAVAATVFLILTFAENASQISAAQLEGAWSRVLSAAAGYILCGVFLGLIWWLVVRAAGRAPPPFKVCVPVHMATQLGKYLPGNVGHFAARHLVMRNHGSTHIELIASGLLEALVLMTAAAMLASAVIQPATEQLLGWDLTLGTQLAVFSLAAGAAFPALVIAYRRGWIKGLVLTSRSTGALLIAVVVALAFFLGMSACLIFISAHISLADAVAIVPWVAAAWLLGYVVPGAPGGIGVREFVLVLGLSPLVGEAPAVLDAALLRLVTIGGDALTALAGAIAMRRFNRTA